MKLIRVTSSLFRFISNYRRRSKTITASFSAQDLAHLQVWLVKEIQILHFSKDIINLKRGPNVSGVSKLKFLHPFLDKDGVIRACGRLQNSNLSFDTKHPIIYKNNKFGEMIFPKAINQ